MLAENPFESMLAESKIEDISLDIYVQQVVPWPWGETRA